MVSRPSGPLCLSPITLALQYFRTMNSLHLCPFSHSSSRGLVRGIPCTQSRCCTCHGLVLARIILGTLGYLLHTVGIFLCIDSQLAMLLQPKIGREKGRERGEHYHIWYGGVCMQRGTSCASGLSPVESNHWHISCRDTGRNKKTMTIMLRTLDTGRNKKTMTIMLRTLSTLLPHLPPGSQWPRPPLSTAAMTEGC